MEKIAELATMSEAQKNSVLTKTAEPRDFVCYKQVVKHFSKNCFNLGQVGLNAFLVL